MGPSKYTAQQRETATVEALKHGWSAKELAEAADFGTLSDDLEPFELGVSTARDWIVAAKYKAREQPADLRASIEEAKQEALRLAVQEMMQVEERQREGEYVGRALTEAVRMIRDLEKWANQPEPVHNGQHPRSTPDVDTGPEPTLDSQIRKAAKAKGKAASGVL